ncbi:hypothetical protein D3C75_968540 [compost metagenome]
MGMEDRIHTCSCSSISMASGHWGLPRTIPICSFWLETEPTKSWLSAVEISNSTRGYCSENRLSTSGSRYRATDLEMPNRSVPRTSPWPWASSSFTSPHRFSISLAYSTSRSPCPVNSMPRLPRYTKRGTPSSFSNCWSR